MLSKNNAVSISFLLLTRSPAKIDIGGVIFYMSHENCSVLFLLLVDSLKKIAENAALFSDLHPTHDKHKHGCW